MEFNYQACLAYLFVIIVDMLIMHQNNWKSIKFSIKYVSTLISRKHSKILFSSQIFYFELIESFIKM